MTIILEERVDWFYKSNCNNLPLNADREHDWDLYLDPSPNAIEPEDGVEQPPLLPARESGVLLASPTLELTADEIATRLTGIQPVPPRELPDHSSPPPARPPYRSTRRFVDPETGRSAMLPMGLSLPRWADPSCDSHWIDRSLIA